MNNRFKFRAYSKELRKIYEVDTICPYEDNHTKGGEVFLKGVQYNSFYFPEEVEVMQCTGLKDKNGKLIYEGDILKRPVSYPKNSYFYEVVIWERKRWQLARPQKCNCQFPQKQCKHCEKIPERKNWFFQNNDTSFKDFYESEVVGNIYENKELLDERD